MADSYSNFSSVREVRDNNVFNDIVNLSSSTSAQEVKAGVTGLVMEITDLIVSTDTEQYIYLVDSDSTAITGKLYLPDNSVWSKIYDTPLRVASGNTLNAVCEGSSGNVSVQVVGYTHI